MKCRGPRTGKGESRKEDTAGAVMGSTMNFVKWKSAGRKGFPTAPARTQKDHTPITPLQGRLGPRDRAAWGLAGGLRANTG